MIKLSIIVPVYNTENLILRCLDSITLTPEIELIIIDDCSTDNSLNIIKEWIKDKNNENIILIHNEINLGVGLTVNKGYDIMRGEYVMTLCDDDYLANPIDLKQLDGTDFIYYNMRINNGTIWELKPETRVRYCGATKFMRTGFIGKDRRSGKRYCGDLDFYIKLRDKKPTEKYTNQVLYHYNFPRKGSLIDKVIKGATE